MPISSFGLEANIIKFPLKLDFDYRINVRKDFAFLRYAPKFAGDEAGVSFLDYNAINPIDNLTITDQTYRIPENSPFAQIEEIKLTKKFMFPKGKFLLTDVFVTKSNGVQEPLYFRHSLSTLGFAPIEVEVLDTNFNPVPTDEFAYYDETVALSLDSRYVYTNHRSAFDPIKRLFQVFYVRYKNPTTFETIIELLNPKPVFEEALFIINAKTRSYSIQEGFGENEITIHFDTQNFSPTPLLTPRVAIKSSKTDRIFVTNPTFNLPNRKWNLRVSRGEFFKDVAGLVEELIIGTGDGVEDTFDLTKASVVANSLEVEVDGVPTEAYTFSQQTGPSDTDQIVFDSAPALGEEIKVSFGFDPQAAKYYIPEWDNQIFSPVRPYKSLLEHRAFVLDKRLVYVEPNPVSNLGITGFYVYIMQQNIMGEVSKAITNDPDADVYTTLKGNVTDVFFIKDAIESIAENDGFIRLNVDLDPDLDTYITYRYSEDWYVYKGVETNPALNPEIRDRKIVVYLKPELSRFNLTGKITNSISTATYHLIVDNADNIVGANEDVYFKTYESESDSGGLNYLIDSTLASTDVYTDSELEIISGPNSGRRLQIIAYDISLKKVTVAANYVQAIGSNIKYRINKKFFSYQVFDPLSATIFEYQGWDEIYRAHPHFNIILAEVRPVNTIAINDLKLQDIRVRGGGIQSPIVGKARNVQREVDWYWDLGHWDGKSYPGMAALLIELPRAILQERGGDFTREQVRQIVHRHLADGYYPLIIYYDRSTEILHLDPSDSTVLVSWLDIGADSYKIYYGNSFNLLTNTVDVSGETSVSIVDLENNKPYYFKVEAYIDGIPSFSSRIAVAVPFDLAVVKDPAVYGEALFEDGVYSSV